MEKLLVLQHINNTHPHPLLLNKERIRKESDEHLTCSGCERQVLDSSFYSCAEPNCGYFYLHKGCAEAPMEIPDHPFHPDHPLILRLPSKEQLLFGCWFCHGIGGKGFSYHCFPCMIHLHMYCALLLFKTANHVNPDSKHPHTLFLFEDHHNQLSYRNCRGCSSPSIDAFYTCVVCKYFWHKKCFDLPYKINHPYHRKHQLVLQSDFGRMTIYPYCNLCKSNDRGMFYSCSVCNVYIHNDCARTPSVINEDKSHHKHPFTLLLRPNSSFNCDACGTQGDSVSYICCTCHIQVHKDCISIPCIIRINLHHHPISHSFCFRIDIHDSRAWECKICYKEVNLEQGSYCCSRPDCNFVIHVKCAIDKENRRLYGIIELKNLDEFEEDHFKSDKSLDPIIRVIKEIQVGDNVIAAEIEHFSHEHNLILSTEIKDNKFCDGCVQPISSLFYYCSNCDFFLHKACAEFWRKCSLWFDANPFTLQNNPIFDCDSCGYFCGGFSYRNDERDVDLCLRCIALSHSLTYQAHEPEPHHLFFDLNYNGNCSACDNKLNCSWRCKDKDCNFALDPRCLTLPRVAWHKCDEHSLTLTYQNHTDYSLEHYCDICEKIRHPNLWFYYCQDCEGAMHPACVLSKYPYIKVGSKFTHETHPHPLTFVHKVCDYPQCHDCGEPCKDLSLQCAECNFIFHLQCILYISSVCGVK